MKNTYIIYTAFMILLSSCAPALPGSLPVPKDFQQYSDRAERALAQSQLELKESEKILQESRQILSEVKEISAEVEAKRMECKRALSQAQSSLSSAQRERQNAKNMLNEAKLEREKIASQPTPIPSPTAPPHSASDAP